MAAALEARRQRAGADGADAAAGQEFWHADRHRRHRRGRFQPPAVSRSRRCEGKADRGQAVIVATGARANYLGLPSEEAYKNRGRQRLRRVRRGAAALPQQAAGGGRRRRFGRRRGDLPEQVRQPGLHGPSPRQAAGLEDHGRAGREQSQDRDRLEPPPGRSAGQRPGRA